MIVRSNARDGFADIREHCIGLGCLTEQFTVLLPVVVIFDDDGDDTQSIAAVLVGGPPVAPAPAPIGYRDDRPSTARGL